jgi:ABC-2 type transport system permease protein
MNPALRIILNEARMQWRGLFSSGKTKWLAPVLIAIAVLALIGVSFPIALVIRELDTPYPVIAYAFVSTLMILQCSLMIAQALGSTIEAVYVRGDLDLLFSAPLSPWTVLIVRGVMILSSVALFWTLLVTPVAVWAAILGKPHWFSLPLSVFAIAVFSTGVGLFLANVLFRVLGPRNTRIAAQILAALIGAGLFLVVQLYNIMGDATREAATQRIAASLIALAPSNAHPLWWPARGVMGEPFFALGLIGVGAIVFFLAANSFARRFATDAAAIAGMGQKRKAASGRVKPFKGGLGRVLMRKEWRVIGRDPMLLSNSLLQIVYLVPLLALLWREVATGGDLRDWMGLIAAFIVFLGASLATSLTWITVSAEDAPDLLKSAPVERSQLDNAKLWAGVLPIVALMALPAAALAYLDPWDGFFVALGAFASAYSAGLIGVWFPNPGNRKDFRRRRTTSLSASIGQSFVVLGWSAATGLAVSGLWALGLIPALISMGLLAALSESRKNAVYEAA